MQNNQLIILGAGGHAKGVVDTIVAQQRYQLYGLTAPEQDCNTTDVLGYPILGSDACIPDLHANGIENYIVGMGATGNNDARKRLFELGAEFGLQAVTVQHPGATVAGSADVLSGTVLFAGAIVGASSHIGHNVIVNHGAIVDHDNHISDHAHIAPGACLCGNVTVGYGAHIGAGAVVIQGISIGERAVVGAGAVVTSNVDAGTVVTGVPARVLHNRTV